MCTVHHRPIAGAPFLLATQHPFFLSFSFEAPYPSKKKKKLFVLLDLFNIKYQFPTKLMSLVKKRHNFKGIHK